MESILDFQQSKTDLDMPMASFSIANRGLFVAAQTTGVWVGVSRGRSVVLSLKDSMIKSVRRSLLRYHSLHTGLFDL